MDPGTPTVTLKLIVMMGSVVLIFGFFPNFSPVVSKMTVAPGLRKTSHKERSSLSSSLHTLRIHSDSFSLSYCPIQSQSGWPAHGSRLSLARHMPPPPLRHRVPLSKSLGLPLNGESPKGKTGVEEKGKNKTIQYSKEERRIREKTKIAMERKYQKGSVKVQKWILHQLIWKDVTKGVTSGWF